MESKQTTFWQDSSLNAERIWRERAKSAASHSGRVFDLGGGSRFQGMIREDDLGPESIYICVDIYNPAHPDVTGDLTSLPFVDSCVDLIVCDAVLEHVHHPHQAVKEMWRILKPGGWVFAGVPFQYPFHDRVDYYRYTDMGLRVLFENFTEVEILPLGDYLFHLLLQSCGYRWGLARRVSPILGPVRIVLKLIYGLYNRLLGRSGQTTLDRVLQRSPVGWMVICQKPT